eukprot:12888359-Prorocentrum_lima.AAC.1
MDGSFIVKWDDDGEDRQHRRDTQHPSPLTRNLAGWCWEQILPEIVAHEECLVAVMGGWVE